MKVTTARRRRIPTPLTRKKMHPNLSIEYENARNLSVMVGRAAASGGSTRDEKILPPVGFTWTTYFYKIYTTRKCSLRSHLLGLHIFTKYTQSKIAKQIRDIYSLNGSPFHKFCSLDQFIHGSVQAPESFLVLCHTFCAFIL